MFPWENENKKYSGVGSRECPANIMLIMQNIASILNNKGWILRSGGANGADTAFELGAISKEIYLPWPNFNGRKESMLDGATEQAFKIAQKYHPAWNKLSNPARALIARNTHQVLGKDCDSPVSFVLCWTPDGAVKETSMETGGTGQAIRIAVAYDISVYNLARQEHLELWRKCL